MRQLRADLIVIVVCLALCLVPWLWLSRSAPDAAYVRISCDGQVSVYALSEPRTLDLCSNGYHLSVAITADGVQVTDADCPDRVCVHTGRIATAGSAVVCVPARVSVSLVSDGEGEYDVITG